MWLDVAVSPQEASNWEKKAVILVDVIRASSTIVTLFELGCRSVIPVANANDAMSIGKKLDLITIGERNGEIIPGFHFNNSPLQLMSADVRGKDIVLSTTNGTLALGKVASNNKNIVIIGSAMNATACSRHVLRMAFNDGRGLGIVCAGRNGRFALDDVVCAGLLVERIISAANNEEITIGKSDSANAALQLFHAYPSLMAAFIQSESGSILKQLGEEGDLDLCSQVDVSEIVPVVGDCPGFAGFRIHK